MTRSPHWISMTALSFVLLVSTDAQLVPLNLRLVRDHGSPQTLNLGDCITGKLYAFNPAQSLSDPTGDYISDTLELPWRSNNQDISSIPTGSYDASVREDGRLGWRLELIDPSHIRANIEIHLGNWPRNSTGCILLGTQSSDACHLVNSQSAVDQLRRLYGDSTSRALRISVE